MNELMTLDQQDTTPEKHGASTAIEQSRAVAETQAAIIVAKKFPRDENAAFLKIKSQCKRKTLAAAGSYAYKRGNQMVTGASIRLAEVLARAWGNIDYGFRELDRKTGVSEVEAYCWDMENNTKATRIFHVKHWRDTKQGGYALRDERDIYELIASQAQRRVRACILEMIPGDVVEAAEDECKKALTSGEKPMEERVRDMLSAFNEVGVTQDMIEAYINHKVSALIPNQLVKLQQIYTSIKDGVAGREEFFKLDSDKTEDLPKGKADANDVVKDEELEQIKGNFPEYYNQAVADVGEPTSKAKVAKIKKKMGELIDNENAGE